MLGRAIDRHRRLPVEIRVQPRFFLNETKNNTTPIAARIMAMVKPADEISAR